MLAPLDAAEGARSRRVTPRRATRAEGRRGSSVPQRTRSSDAAVTSCGLADTPTPRPYSVTYCSEADTRDGRASADWLLPSVRVGMSSDSLARCRARTTSSSASRMLAPSGCATAWRMWSWYEDSYSAAWWPSSKCALRRSAVSTGSARPAPGGCALCALDVPYSAASRPNAKCGLRRSVGSHRVVSTRWQSNVVAVAGRGGEARTLAALALLALLFLGRLRHGSPLEVAARRRLHDRLLVAETEVGRLHAALHGLPLPRVVRRGLLHVVLRRLRRKVGGIGPLRNVAALRTDRGCAGWGQRHSVSETA